MTTPVCQVRAVKGYERNSMIRDPRAAYWVRCRICPSAGNCVETLMPGIFARDHYRSLGWAPDLESAIRYADAHAAIHLDKTCPACHHTPEVDVTADDTNALMTARSAT